MILPTGPGAIGGTFGVVPAYSATELTAIRDFRQAGGNILMIAEGSAGSAALDGYNGLLGAIGSSIRYDGSRSGGNTATTAFVADHPFMNGVDTFGWAAGNGLAGGTLLVTDRDGITVAVTEVPEPGSIALLALGLGALAWLQRQRARA